MNKKLDVVWTTSKFAITNLEALWCVLWISYTVQFSQNKIKSLVESWNKNNSMNSAFTQVVNNTSKTNNFRVKKIDVTSIKTYGIISANFFL